MARLRQPRVEIIKELCATRGWSAEQLALRIERKPPTIREIYRGGKCYFSTVEAIARALNVSPGSLLPPDDPDADSYIPPGSSHPSPAAPTSAPSGPGNVASLIVHILRQLSHSSCQSEKTEIFRDIIEDIAKSTGVPATSLVPADIATTLRLSNTATPVSPIEVTLNVKISSEALSDATLAPLLTTWLTSLGLKTDLEPSKIREDSIHIAFYLSEIEVLTTVEWYCRNHYIPSSILQLDLFQNALAWRLVGNGLTRDHYPYPEAGLFEGSINIRGVPTSSHLHARLTEISSFLNEIIDLVHNSGGRFTTPFRCFLRTGPGEWLLLPHPSEMPEAHGAADYVAEAHAE